MNHMPTQCLFVFATNMSRLKALNITKHTCTSTRTHSPWQRPIASDQVELARDPWSAPAGHQLSCRGTTCMTTHKLNKHDFWPGCQTLWLAASHKLNSHKLNKHDFWPGCQTLWLAASHKLNSHKLNKHDFWPGCQTLWLAASHKLNSHKLNSHKLNKHDFWPGCQTLQLAASHNWLSRLAARPCGWQPASRSTIAQRTALFARTSHQNVRYFIMATDPTRFLSRRFNHCFSLTS